MVVLNGINNFLELIYQNWTLIVVVLGVAITIYKKVKEYNGKSNEEKIEIAKKQIQEIILKLISDAEVDYEEWNKAGSIKRSQVIEEIFIKYPILSKAVNQEELIKWIDEIIDSALVTLREIVDENK